MNRKQLLTAGLIAIISVTSYAKPPHARGNGMHRHITSPPAHAKAWGKKHAWKNMNKEERKALKQTTETEAPKWLSHAKALGKELLK